MSDASKRKRLDELQFSNTFTAELPGDPWTTPKPTVEGGPPPPVAERLLRGSRVVQKAFWSAVPPEELPDPRLIAFSPEALSLIELDEMETGKTEFLSVFSGNLVPYGTRPWAHAYGGHQFGVYAGQLGDGRAISLGEVVNSRGQRWELQLKGSGCTPYSRGGDGLAVVRSSIREFLASEFMHKVGMPTTRAMTLVGSTLPVHREEMEPAAVVCRLAPSWLHHYRNESGLVKQLADYVIRHHYTELLSPDPTVSDGWKVYARFFAAVVKRTAEMIAGWQSIGFCHGVMNTDNMSILGITLDYGPYAFLDTYDPGWICNHSDDEGRYAFDKQPAIGKWNLEKLGDTLLVLMGGEAGDMAERKKRGLQLVKEILKSYDAIFSERYLKLMGKKLGLNTPTRTDSDKLITPLLDILATSGVDYTNFFRGLSHFESAASPISSSRNNTLLEDMLLSAFDRKVPDAAVESSKEHEHLAARWRSWATAYAARLAKDDETQDPVKRDQLRSVRMDAVNPRNVIRNWIAQEIIDRVQQSSALQLQISNEDRAALGLAPKSMANVFGMSPAIGAAGNSTASVPPEESLGYVEKAMKVLVHGAFGGTSSPELDVLDKRWRGEAVQFTGAKLAFVDSHSSPYARDKPSPASSDNDSAYSSVNDDNFEELVWQFLDTGGGQEGGGASAGGPGCQDAENGVKRRKMETEPLGFGGLVGGMPGAEQVETRSVSPSENMTNVHTPNPPSGSSSRGPGFGMTPSFLDDRRFSDIFAGPPPVSSNLGLGDGMGNAAEGTTASDSSAAKLKLDQMHGFSGKGLQVRVLGVPQHNAKSRVETQIKICVQLVTDKGEKVGGWSHLRLPELLVAKERLRKSKLQDDFIGPGMEKSVLDLETIVVCASDVRKTVTTCLGCVQRERKRTKKKDANSKKSVKAEDVPSDLMSGDDTLDDELLALEQKKVILFNCGQVVDFSSGDTILPTRITCYCRHHSEKLGFCIYFVFRDCTRQIIATGISPPIMITDDHKSSKGKTRKRPRVEDSDIPLDSSLESFTDMAVDNVMSLGEEPGSFGGDVLAQSLGQSTSPLFGQNPTSPIDDFGLYLQTTALPTAPIPQMRDSRHQQIAHTESRIDIGNVGTSADGTAQAVQEIMGMANLLRSLATETRPAEQSVPSVPVPAVNRVIPAEGPLHGGLEVTVLGSGFYDGLTVLFGGIAANPTHFWSPTTMVCILPPSPVAGIVPVTFKEHALVPATENSGATFTYKDDSDRALMELALQVLGLRMTGKVEDARQIAMRIVADSAGPQAADSPASGMKLNLAASLLIPAHTATRDELEYMLVQALSSVELLYAPQELLLDFSRTQGGHTMLHLASISNMRLLVKWLISRGCNVDAQDVNGFSALHFAAWMGRKELVVDLLEAGASTGLETVQGFLPAQLASSRQHAHVTDVIFEHEEASDMASLVSQSSGDYEDDVSDVESGFEEDYDSVADGEPIGMDPSDLDGLPPQLNAEDISLIQNAVEAAAEAGMNSIGVPPVAGWMPGRKIAGGMTPPCLYMAGADGFGHGGGRAKGPGGIPTPVATEAVAIASLLPANGYVSLDAFRVSPRSPVDAQPVVDGRHNRAYHGIAAPHSADGRGNYAASRAYAMFPPSVRKDKASSGIPLSLFTPKASAKRFSAHDSKESSPWYMPSLSHVPALLALPVSVPAIPGLDTIIAETLTVAQRIHETATKSGSISDLWDSLVSFGSKSGTTKSESKGAAATAPSQAPHTPLYIPEPNLPVHTHQSTQSDVIDEVAEAAEEEEDIIVMLMEGDGFLAESGTEDEKLVVDSICSKSNVCIFIEL
ncbi:hypothetical protein HK104_008773 [Borealophlyctis nickersoniae]|nr:hypothetical protein HK104_008773 [Borealophlyctis nickersoniae]